MDTGPIREEQRKYQLVDEDSQSPRNNGTEQHSIQGQIAPRGGQAQRRFRALLFEPLGWSDCSTVT